MATILIMIKTVKWTAGNKAEIEISVKSVYALDQSGRYKTSGYKQVDYVLTIDGDDHSTISGPQTIDHPVAVAQIGKVLMTAANYDRVLAATKLIDESHRDHNSKIDRNFKGLAALGTGDINKDYGSDC